MTDVRIRQLDDWVVDVHRQQARLHGKSLEKQLREILTAAALAKMQAMVADLRAALDELRDKYGTFSDSAVLIREEGDKR